MNTTVYGRGFDKWSHGILLPLVTFIAGHVSFFALALVFTGGEAIGYYMLFSPLIFVVLVLSILLILGLNALLMIPNWKRRRTVWFIGAIVPACIVVAEVIYARNMSIGC
jgi:phosphoglycerol transferase MdoB-like AlkP superfamily enzyme